MNSIVYRELQGEQECAFLLGHLRTEQRSQLWVSSGVGSPGLWGLKPSLNISNPLSLAKLRDFALKWLRCGRIPRRLFVRTVVSRRDAQQIAAVYNTAAAFCEGTNGLAHGAT